MSKDISRQERIALAEEIGRFARSKPIELAELMYTSDLAEEILGAGLDLYIQQEQSEEHKVPVRTGKMAGYAITHDTLILKFILEDGGEIEVPVNASVAICLGDDIFHGMYIGEDDEGKAIHSISRIFDLASESVLESGNGIKYEPEQG